LQNGLGNPESKPEEAGESLKNMTWDSGQGLPGSLTKLAGENQQG
jgi:hypothetical protein